jgi:peptide/nickel transport system permease protein
VTSVKRNARALLGVPMVFLFVSTALVGPSLAPYPIRSIDLAHELAPPSAAHPLGTGENGLDVLSVILHGARLAALVSVATVATSLTVGALLGGAAAYVGGRVGALVARVTDAAQSFPSLVVNMAVLALVARPGVAHMVLALTVTGWVGYARVARAEVLRLREREFVMAARALGASPMRVFFRHVLPNAAGPLVVQATFGLGAAVLAEASLSFLGLGPGATASWGALLDQGTAHLLRAPRLAMTAGTAIAVTVLGFNLTGDWLRDRLDPKA